jgi:MFS family permease
MELRDVMLLLHPAIAVIVVYPLIGIVVNRALQVRQRRLQTATEGKSKIPPVVGQEHVKLGRTLTAAVVGIVLIALAFTIFGNILEKKVWTETPFKVILITLFFLAAIASLALLYKASDKMWRGIFATLSGIAIVILGCQDGVYRQTNQWYISHYYYGVAVALLMIFSLAILPDIYKDKTNRWRKVHIALNSIATLMFIAQGITGSLALLEVPLSWQETYFQKLYEQQCQIKPCTIQAPDMPKKP